MTQKENLKTKYTDHEAKQFLQEIRVEYEIWKVANQQLKGPFATPGTNDLELLRQRVQLFSGYKDFIDQQKYAEKFDSRGNLHSSVLEEFMYYLFKDMVFGFSELALLGKSHTFKDLFFNAPNFKEMVAKPYLKMEKKDHDFAIGVNINAKFSCAGNPSEEQHHFQVPAIAIECKTYLDKSMLEGSSTAAEQLKHRNPNALYFVVAEWLKLTEQVNLRKYKVDQIYILRKQKTPTGNFDLCLLIKKIPFSSMLSNICSRQCGSI